MKRCFDSVKVTVDDEALGRSIRASLLKNNPYVVVFLLRAHDASTQIKSQEDIHQTGVKALIFNVLGGPNEKMTLLLLPQNRVTISHFIPSSLSKHTLLGSAENQVGIVEMAGDKVELVEESVGAPL